MIKRPTFSSHLEGIVILNPGLTRVTYGWARHRSNRPGDKASSLNWSFFGSAPVYAGTRASFGSIPFI